MPLFDKDGSLATLQYIDNEGGKLYHPGGEAGGKFWMVGSLDEPGTLYVAEGFATAATIYETTVSGYGSALGFRDYPWLQSCHRQFRGQF